MTANIKQNVVPRSSKFSPSKLSSSFISQRGSVSNQTITLTFGILFIIICAALGFFYLQQVLGSASQGSDIHALESKINELGDRQRELELEGAELRSIRNLENNLEKLNLVNTDSVAYLSPTPESVALAN